MHAANAAPGRSARKWTAASSRRCIAAPRESDIIIVNHHLFFADLSLRQTAARCRVLPDFTAAIFDEAHELEDVAGSYFGVSVSNLRFEELARDVAATLQQKKPSRRE